MEHAFEAGFIGLLLWGIVMVLTVLYDVDRHPPVRQTPTAPDTGMTGPGVPYVKA